MYNELTARQEEISLRNPLDVLLASIKKGLHPAEKHDLTPKVVYGNQFLAVGVQFDERSLSSDPSSVLYRLNLKTWDYWVERFTLGNPKIRKAYEIDPLDLERIFDSDPKKIPVRAILGEDREEVARLLEERGLKVHHIRKAVMGL